MSLMTASSIVLTAPAAVDGRAEIATLNNRAAATYVGDLWEPSGMGGAAVRLVEDEITEGHGSVFGAWQLSARSFTLKVKLTPGASIAASDLRYQKLCRAVLALAADGTMVWTDSDTYTKAISYRLEQPVGDPNTDREVLLSLKAQDPRIYNTTPQTGSSPKTPVGKIDTYPTFTLTPTGGNVVLTNTTAGLGSPAVTLQVGSPYVTTGGGAVTVDFLNQTITQGGTRKDGSIIPTSTTWWPIVPGVANSWTVTNASSVSISFNDAWLVG